MTTVLIDNATPETDAFVEKLEKNSCNIIYSNDVVSRGYGFLSFEKDFVDNSKDDLDKKVPLGPIGRRVLNVGGKVDDVVETEGLAGLIGVFSQYRHMGNVIYYATAESVPLVLKDMGAYHKPIGETHTFRSIKYKPVKSPLSELMDWHMNIIRGPGLSYHPDDLLAPTSTA